VSEAQDPIDPVSDIEELAAKVSAVVNRATLHELAAEGQYCPMCWKDLTPEIKDDPDAIYHEVVSWVTGPKLQSPVLRGQTGRIAHKTCIDKVLNGQSPDQEAIPGLEL
jgi:hypothetical protein